MDGEEVLAEACASDIATDPDSDDCVGAEDDDNVVDDLEAIGSGACVEWVPCQAGGTTSLGGTAPITSVGVCEATGEGQLGMKDSHHTLDGRRQTATRSNEGADVHAPDVDDCCSWSTDSGCDDFEMEDAKKVDGRGKTKSRRPSYYVFNGAAYGRMLSYKQALSAGVDEPPSAEEILQLDSSFSPGGHFRKARKLVDVAVVDRWKDIAKRLELDQGGSGEGGSKLLMKKKELLPKEQWEATVLSAHSRRGKCVTARTVYKQISKQYVGGGYGIKLEDVQSILNQCPACQSRVPLRRVTPVSDNDAVDVGAAVQQQSGGELSRGQKQKLEWDDVRFVSVEAEETSLDALRREHKVLLQARRRRVSRMKVGVDEGGAPVVGGPHSRGVLFKIVSWACHRSGTARRGEGRKRKAEVDDGHDNRAASVHEIPVEEAAAADEGVGCDDDVHEGGLHHRSATLKKPAGAQRRIKKSWRCDCSFRVETCSSMDPSFPWCIIRTFCRHEGHDPSDPLDVYNSKYHPLAKRAVEDDLLEGASVAFAARASRRRVERLKQLVSETDQAVYRFYLLEHEVANVLYRLRMKGATVKTTSRSMSKEQAETKRKAEQIVARYCDEDDPSTIEVLDPLGQVFRLHQQPAPIQGASLEESFVVDVQAGTCTCSLSMPCKHMMALGMMITRKMIPGIVYEEVLNEEASLLEEDMVVCGQPEGEEPLEASLIREDYFGDEAEGDLMQDESDNVLRSAMEEKRIFTERLNFAIDSHQHSAAVMKNVADVLRSATNTIDRCLHSV